MAPGTRRRGCFGWLRRRPGTVDAVPESVAVSPGTSPGGATPAASPPSAEPGGSEAELKEARLRLVLLRRKSSKTRVAEAPGGGEGGEERNATGTGTGTASRLVSSVDMPSERENDATGPRAAKLPIRPGGGYGSEDSDELRNNVPLTMPIPQVDSRGVDANGKDMGDRMLDEILQETQREEIAGMRDSTSDPCTMLNVHTLRHHENLNPAPTSRQINQLYRVTEEGEWYVNRRF